MNPLHVGDAAGLVEALAGAGIMDGRSGGVPGGTTGTDTGTDARYRIRRPNGKAIHVPAELQKHLDRLDEVREQAVCGPDPKATDVQHARGKLTARERIALLLDPGSFHEVGLFARARNTGNDDPRPYTDGVVTGWGTVHGRRIMVYAHDFRLGGASLGEVFAAKIHRIQDLAERFGVPVVGLNDGVGARIQEGALALAGYGGIFVRNVRASGLVPQISVMLGPCAGGAVYSPALTDFTILVRDLSHMFITGPDVLAAVTGERVSKDELGGCDVHARHTGVASLLASDEPEALANVRRLLSYLPSSCVETPPYKLPNDDPERRCEELYDIVKADPRQSYDMGKVIRAIVDDHDFFELQPQWATNIITGFARLGGEVVGIVANQPMVYAGVLDIAASEKGARFIRTCDAYNIPIVSFVDVPGFLPGVAQEHGGIIRHGAKLLYAYCEATVPRIQLICRKAYGGAYIVMDSKEIGADLCYAWPSNEVAVMGPEGAASIMLRKEMAKSADPDRLRQEFIDDYRERIMHPYAAAEHGLIDDVIDPADTRSVLIASLGLLRGKNRPSDTRKHGNQPV